MGVHHFSVKDNIEASLSRPSLAVFHPHRSCALSRPASGFGSCQIRRQPAAARAVKQFRACIGEYVGLITIMHLCIIFALWQKPSDSSRFAQGNGQKSWGSPKRRFRITWESINPK